MKRIKALTVVAVKDAIEPGDTLKDVILAIRRQFTPHRRYTDVCYYSISTSVRSVRKDILAELLLNEHHAISWCSRYPKTKRVIEFERERRQFWLSVFNLSN